LTCRTARTSSVAAAWHTLRSSWSNSDLIIESLTRTPTRTRKSLLIYAQNILLRDSPTITTVKCRQRLPEHTTSRDPPCYILPTHSAEEPFIFYH
jgi:hypothetical protein